ncbi:hypothetical protein D3C80_1610570 [compost metagenome]
MLFYRGVGCFEGVANPDSLAAFTVDACGVNDGAVPGRATGARGCRTLSALYRTPGVRGRHGFAAATDPGAQRFTNRLPVRVGAHLRPPAFR